MTRPRRLPGPLVALLAIAAVLGLAWIVLVPALQGPDESGHYSYTEKLVEQRTLPWTPYPGEDADEQRALSSAHETALLWAGLEPLRANVAARPFWTTLDERLWRERDAALPGGGRDDVGFTSTFRNPPLYYVYQAPPYAVGLLGDFFDRTFVMRLANIPLLLGTVLLTWLLAGRLLGPRLLPRTVATAVVALQPQLMNITATINADNLLVLLCTGALLLALVVVQDGLTGPRGVGLLGLVAAATLTHPRGAVMVVPAIAAIAIAEGRRRGLGIRAAAIGVGGSAVAAVAAATVAVATGNGNPNQFVSYVWQFYLPKLGFMTPTIGPPDYDVHDVLVERLWGAYAQLEISLPTGLADALWIGTLGAAAALVVLGLASRDRLRRRLPELAVALSAALSLVVVLHVLAYRRLLDDATDPLIAGRYALPLFALVGAGVALLVDALPRRARPVGAALVVAGLTVVQLTGLGLTAERFYG